MSYKSNGVTVPEGLAPNHIMESQTLVKLHNLKKVRPLDLKYRCDICQNYFAHSKWFVLTHKATVHKIPIPHNYKG